MAVERLGARNITSKGVTEIRKEDLALIILSNKDY